MITQSFLYNAIFFTYALVLTKIYGVPDTTRRTTSSSSPSGTSSARSPSGHLFDSVGRRKMIAGTYLLSGVLLAVVSAVLFNAGMLNAVTQTDLVVRHLLLRLGRRQCRLPHGERDLPGGGAAKAIAVFFAIAQSFGAFGRGSTAS